MKLPNSSQNSCSQHVFFVVDRYFCKSGAASSTPTQGDDEADVCPPGHYCMEGTSQPQKCPLGTYSNSTLLTAADECLNCTAGMLRVISSVKQLF